MVESVEQLPQGRAASLGTPPPLDNPPWVGSHGGKGLVSGTRRWTCAGHLEKLGSLECAHVSNSYQHSCRVAGVLKDRSAPLND